MDVDKVRKLMRRILDEAKGNKQFVLWDIEGLPECVHHHTLTLDEHRASAGYANGFINALFLTQEYGARFPGGWFTLTLSYRHERHFLVFCGDPTASLAEKFPKYACLLVEEVMVA
jgi:hypothetical protein